MMRQVASDPGMGRARMLVERMGLDCALHRAALDQAVPDASGARSPVGPARLPVETVELVEARGDESRERVTPLGMRTARVRLPRVLRALRDHDPRRRAALRYQHLVEVANAAPCGALVSVRVDGGGRISDGGASWKLGISEELRAFHFAIGGAVALAPASRRGSRRLITERAMLDMVCLSNQELRSVLRAHGWAARSVLVKHLAEIVLAALDRMAMVETWDREGG